MFWQGQEFTTRHGINQGESMHSLLRRSGIAMSLVLLSSAHFAWAQQADMGVNVDMNTYWSTSEVWANIMNEVSTWGTYDTPWIANTALTFTSDGYPLENASVGTGLPDYPDGVYNVSYTGSATLTAIGMGTISDVVTTGNTTTAELTINHSSSTFLSLNVSNINPSDPMDDLQIMTPGTTAGQLFTSNFLNRLAPMSTIRFMNWDMTNGNTDINWSDRTMPQNPIQTSSNGVALEDQIALCNQTGKNGWFNIPVGASNSYIKSMADLLHSTMASNETIYVEYSNELWNAGFSQYATNLANAAANPLLAGITNTTTLAGDEDAYRTMQISQIFQQEFGSDFSRVKIVLGGQCVYDYFTQQGLAFLQNNFGNPSNYISDVAIAPYIAITNAQNVSGLTLNQLFSDLFSSANSIIANIQTYKSLLAPYNLSMVAYEGGQGLTPLNTATGTYPNQALMEQAENDPRMGQLIDELMTAWTQAGGGLFNYFDFVAADSNSGLWGLLQNINQVGSVKWDAYLRAMLPLGDVNGDGVVNSADLAIIQADMGDSNMWYQQGDLNGDNVVNADDEALFFLGYAEQQASGTSVVPEPGMHLAIIGTTGLICARRNRRRASARFFGNTHVAGNKQAA